jgi:sec-independent protein translocase protein TatB
MEIPVFDLSLPKLLILAVLALVVFGPKELPKIAGQAGRFLRELRKLAEGAQADLREGLGPEFADFELTDLSPRRFVQKHLLSESDQAGAEPYDPDAHAPDPYAPDTGGRTETGVSGPAQEAALVGGGDTVFDAEAT